ncbi:hypothetical protein Saro_2723 [Novosphingobium aromaticivorans DSM 12444]|uniref:Uncharacterized protein n=1 Tax=Novosphingobium aromaticivorans (strain ATCC 700278 / DSM 12444 / CCUG 56034 / CIP 105152 / NBRC 16084 / F199) TaxID=279238 RepID=Q2G4R4_NOVAD|nr:hypothetical protein [Novosphingobium aromaticivorans]ABD27159.1 hypothetical protein Saro_2723 [Novosphingobium aromaticivorans DSM 12444]SCY89606.1 hypothetical protein SAMN05660666_03477 [Novosphingobium aromaticivorans]
MPELQTSYTGTVAKGYAGMIANGETSNRISRTVEDAAGIAFGKPVYRGSGDHGCTATVGTLATFLGWTVATSAMAPVAGQDADEYQQYDTATIITSGAIYVAVKGAVTDGAALTVGTGGGAADLVGATAADATHIATGWVADETVTDGLCRIVKR